MVEGVCLGYTTDVVMTEIATLTKLKLAQILKIPLTAVTCSIAFDNGKVVPEITIDSDEAAGITTAQIREVMQQVWWGVKPELEDRLKGLGHARKKKEKEG